MLISGLLVKTAPKDSNLYAKTRGVQSFWYSRADNPKKIRALILLLLAFLYQFFTSVMKGISDVFGFFLHYFFVSWCHPKVAESHVRKKMCPTMSKRCILVFLISLFWEFCILYLRHELIDVFMHRYLSRCKGTNKIRYIPTYRKLFYQ